MKSLILSLFIMLLAVSLNAYTISGYINLAETPIEDAVVELYAQQPHMSNSLIDVTTSDENGYYSFSIGSPGMYYVAALIETPVYQYMFFDHVSNPCQATPIQVNNMNPVQTDINFDFQSTIPSGDNSLWGEISDLIGNAVESAKITLLPEQYNHPWMSPYIVYSDENGNYLLENLPDGEYLLSVRHQAHYPYFYNGVSSWMQADVIALENGTVLEINAILESNNLYAVSGYVFDAQSSLPIANAKIYAFPQSGHHSNCGCGGSGNLPTAFTNQEGFYEIFLAQDLYHLLALDTQTYDVEFYDNAATPLTANWIVVDQNIADIDFLLNENPGGSLSISGTLSGGGGNPNNPVPMLAVAVSSDEDWEETVMADNVTGGYIIPDLPSGTYYVYGFSPTALPTYFEDAINFEEAVQVDLQANVTGIDITLHTAQESGYLECSGLVIDDLGNPVSNATVAFVDAFGNVHDYAFTNDDGEYLTPFLGSLNYTALATKTFYTTDATQLPIYGNQTWNFVMTAPITEVEQNQIFLLDLMKIKIYPNPFNPSTTIKFDLPLAAENTNISIYNIKSQLVYNKTLPDLAAGSYTISWLAQDNGEKPLSSGIYLLKIKAGNYLGTAKLLLLK